MSVAEIARQHKMQIKEVVIDLEHLRKSMRHSGHSLEVTPATLPQVRFRIWPRRTYEAFPVSEVPRNVDHRAARAGAARMRLNARKESA